MATETLFDEIRETNELLVNELIKTQELSSLLVKLARRFAWDMWISRGRILIQTAQKDLFIKVNLVAETYVIESFLDYGNTVCTNIPFLYMKLEEFYMEGLRISSE